jgi:secondary thiamine-phosphate synthase enzyme
LAGLDKIGGQEHYCFDAAASFSTFNTVMVHQEELELSTQNNGDMHDLTDKVKEIVRNSQITTGIAHIFNIGSTGAIGAIEFEPGLQKDLPATLNQLIPASLEYGHEQTWHDGNGHSHLQATILGPSLTVPVCNGRLELGMWQQIFHLECDIKSRRRRIIVTIYGE